MGWILLSLLLVIATAGAALHYAIGRNGPAVLNAIDRLTSGGRDVELIHRERIGESPQQKVGVYRTAGDDTLKPVIIFFHGGSWRSGNPDDYGFVARALVPEGFTVVLAGYRLMPGGEYPAMLEDTASAIAWTEKNVARYGGDPDQVIVAGHSAGAYNIVQVALERRWLNDKASDASVIKGVIGLSGPYDFYPFDSDSTKAAFGGAADPEMTQPIHHVRTDAPPMLLVHGEKDTLVGPHNTVTLSAAITEAGGAADAIYFAEMDHNAPLIALASPWRRNRNVLDTIVNFAASPRTKPSVSVQP